MTVCDLYGIQCLKDVARTFWGSCVLRLDSEGYNYTMLFQLALIIPLMSSCSSQDDWLDECSRELTMPLSAVFSASDTNQTYTLHPSRVSTWADLRKQLSAHSAIATRNDTAGPTPTVFVLAPQGESISAELVVDDLITINASDVAIVPGLDWLEPDPDNSSLVRVRGDASSRAVISCARRDRAFFIRYSRSATT